MRNNLIDLLDPILKKTNDILGENLLVSNLRRSTQSSAGYSKAILSIQNNRNRSIGMLRVTKTKSNGIEVNLDIADIPDVDNLTKKLTAFAQNIAQK